MLQPHIRTMIRNALMALLFLPFLAQGQQVSDSLLTSFYNTTLLYYFSDMATTTKQEQFGSLIIESPVNNLLQQAGENRFRYIHSHAELRPLLAAPVKQHQGRTFYTIHHTVATPDTIDILIDGYTIDRVRRKRVEAHPWSAVHIVPEGRFIYDRKSSTWLFYSGEEISSELMFERTQGK